MSEITPNQNITIVVEDITVKIHTPTIKTSNEENKRQLAKYFYKLMEMSQKNK